MRKMKNFSTQNEKFRCAKKKMVRRKKYKMGQKKNSSAQTRWKKPICDICYKQV
jgi:hypothetical protein